MAWIEVHQSLRGNKKLSKFCELLNIKNEAHAIGYLVCLWMWAVDNSPDGNLEGINDNIIAQASSYRGLDKARFVDALIEAGFLDENCALHDWMDYAGRLIERRQVNADRMREARRKRKEESEALNENACDERAGLPYPTVPNPTIPNPTTEGRTINLQPLYSARESGQAAVVGADSISARPEEENTCERKRVAVVGAGSISVDADSITARTEADLALERKRAERARIARLIWMEGLPDLCRDACGDEAEYLVRWLLNDSGANDDQICLALEYMRVRHLAGNLRFPVKYIKALIKDWQDRGLVTTEAIRRDREEFFA